MKNRYWAVFSDRDFVSSLVLAAVLLAASLFVNFYAAIYALERASGPVKDIILINLPVINLDFLV
ncbi:MAG: hypothetical protein NTY66_00420, partial [Candidatus Vogelbacteria bacterium]|nr:hypothetical protein [Candidatus Vogelbacteria bacterium]